MGNTTKLLREVMGLVEKINNTTDHAVFLDYSGHVSLLNVRVGKSKEEYQNKILDCSFYLSGPLSRLEDENLSHLISELKTFLKKGKRNGQAHRSN